MGESLAIKALGPLFKLTEVHLWDDGSSERLELSYEFESPKLNGVDADNAKSDAVKIDGFCSSTENVELGEQLSDLGLPLSFHSNKEKRNAMISGRKKGSAKKSQLGSRRIADIMLDIIEVGEEEKFSTDFLNITGIRDESDMMADADKSSNIPVERWDSLSSTAYTSTISNEYDFNNEMLDLGFCHNGQCAFGFSSISLGEDEATKCKDEAVAAVRVIEDVSFKETCLFNEGIIYDGKEWKGEIDSVNLEAASTVIYDNEGHSKDSSLKLIQDPDFAASYSPFLETSYADISENHKKVESGQWITCWDDISMRRFFYNVETKESVWDPPLGTEKAIDYLNYDPYSSKDARNDNELLTQQYNELSGHWLLTDCVSSISRTKRKKKVRRKKSDRTPSNSHEDLQGVLQEVTPIINKYWCQRYSLFSKFDYGIEMDEEGWFSVTPELLAKHHAIRCGKGVIIDFFTGVGGNAIQFAQRSNHVIAIDIDPNKIHYAQHNAALYGVEDRIDFIRGDSFTLAPKLKADTVFMSPPWGGPDYAKVKTFDINTMLKPKDGLFLFNIGMTIASKIVMFLPRNVDFNQLAELSLAVSPPWSLEVEKNFLNGRLKAVTAYFSCHQA